MIYFVTIYFKCSDTDRYRIEEYLGMRKAMTVNGEWPAIILNDKSLEIVNEIALKGYVELRKKYRFMEATKGFIETISNYLQKEAERDSLFAKKMNEHPEKTPEAVCNYILQEVSRIGQCGYDDDEIYSLAKHFIDEDELKDPGNSNIVSKIVINQHIELSDAEKKKLKEKVKADFALKVKKEAKEEEIKRKEKELKLAEKKKKLAIERKEQESKLQGDLFGGF